jgi:hypothetical protein
MSKFYHKRRKKSAEENAMSELSVSLRLRGASGKHGANLKISNRDIILPNVKREKMSYNVTFVRQDARGAYEKLFADALTEYNTKQKQPCRRIADYYEHISEGKREEAFYEVIAQFGDCESVPVGSETGEAAKRMLEEYMGRFGERNPNLHERGVNGTRF